MIRRVTVVDSGICNLASIMQALRRTGDDVCVTSAPSEVSQAERLILPGVGSFPAAMKALNTQGLTTAILLYAKSQRPLLGICLGMQLLLDAGEEFGETRGLGLVPGRVQAIKAHGQRVPHMGWNQVSAVRTDPLLAGVDGHYLYFVHSYVCAPLEADNKLAVTEYGEPFCSVLRRGNIWGVQAHPEKSQRAGLTLLRNFMELAL